MNPTEYIKNAIRTESPQCLFSSMLTPMTRLLHGAMGICTEAGELLDVLKKCLFYNRKIDHDNVKEELGDVFWYLAIICNQEGWTFEEIMEENIKKLKARYPEKLSEKDEKNRDYQKEQEAAKK